MPHSTLIDLLARNAFERAERDAETIDAIADFEFGPIKSDDGNVSASANQAEDRAKRAAELMVPAIAITLKSKAELMEIAAADFGAATVAHAAFREAANQARDLAQALETAHARLLIALTAVARNNLQGPSR